MAEEQSIDGLIEAQALVEAGLAPEAARDLVHRLGLLAAETDPVQRWGRISRELLRPSHPFSVHQKIFQWNYRAWSAEKRGPAPAWIPTSDEIRGSNLGRWMSELGMASYEALHAWSVSRRADFWGRICHELEIVFQEPPTAVLDPASSPEIPRWFPGAKLNIAASCLVGDPDRIAILAHLNGRLERVTLGELDRLTRRVSHGFQDAGLSPGDRVAVVLPMTVEAVAAYLGIIQAGGVVVSIADSFAAAEIATRLRIVPVKLVVTQDCLPRMGRLLPLYEKVIEAQAPRTLVIPKKKVARWRDDGGLPPLRGGDLLWEDFLGRDDPFCPVPRDSDDPINILFSSGTTGDPKAVPWTQTTPIKCAADGYLHHDLHPGDVLAWPTSLGWMMGPWLIFAGLMNRCTLALYDEIPTGPGFCRFVEQAGVTVLGLVPSLVKAWRAGGAMEGVDWTRIRVFSSTGESSNEEDMLWLMGRAGYRPIIEYCGGTELGGGYITGTVVQPSPPATFSTPAMALDLAIRDEEGRETENGEVFLIPPSVGLSTMLVNADHHDVYFAGTPSGPEGVPLRRHGDQIERLAGGYFRAHGRVDDTMNLGGIKVSSIELERAVSGLDGLEGSAAIAVPPPGGGPSELVFYVVVAPPDRFRPEEMRESMQKQIRTFLNPLFKIKEVVRIDALPRTASNKIMRRKLRDDYARRPVPMVPPAG